MSTFKGTLNEGVFVGCAIDYFRGDLLNEAKVFFLSHFHTDHMMGLEDVWFHKKLEEDPNSRLYCSNITRKMLLKKQSLLGIPRDRIVVIEREPIYVAPYEVTIRVTPLRAGHCPGSIMFLFEACDVTALYTGDFRLTLRDLTLCKPLHDPETHDVIKIHSLYLDTTFASTDYEHFPSREKSKDCIVKIIRQRRSNFKYFVIKSTASTGIEYLMVELSKEFKCQIHASFDLCQDILSCIEHLQPVITNEICKSFIHFCTRTGNCNPCPMNDASMDAEKDIMIIKPSALFFTVHTHSEVLNVKNNFVRVAYSSHSSLSELADFVSYLKPATIYPSVVSNEMTADEVLQEISYYMSKGSRPS